MEQKSVAYYIDAFRESNLLEQQSCGCQPCERQPATQKSSIDISDQLRSCGCQPCEHQPVEDSLKNAWADTQPCEEAVDDFEDFIVSSLSFDSKEVVHDRLDRNRSSGYKRGCLFFCKGENFSTEYLCEAIAGGAIAYVSERLYAAEELGIGAEQMIFAIVVTDVREAMSVACQVAYPQISERIKIIGITGTKGKSTTAFMIKAILDSWLVSNGKPACALLSGVHNFDGVNTAVARLTTDEALVLYRYIAAAIDNGCEYLVMEVSSQALKYHRVQGLHFEIAAFLNFSRDHIGPLEHPDVEDYLLSKLLLVAQAKRLVLNNNLGDEVLARAATVFRGTSIVHYSGEAQGYQLALPGLVNAQNAQAAIIIAQSLNVPDEFIRSGLLAVRVPGRMETFVAADGKIVVVDYAHNGISLKMLLEQLRCMYLGHSICLVFGCAGGKAPNRLLEMSEVAGRLADKVIVTEDDPGPRQIDEICAQIAGYVRDAGGDNVTVIVNRTCAISTAIEDATPDTVVVIAGKGHENRQLRSNGAVPMRTDAAVVADCLNNCLDDCLNDCSG